MDLFGAITPEVKLFTIEGKENILTLSYLPLLFLKRRGLGG